MKTAISVPDDVFEEADRLAERLGKSRSQLYTEAMIEYLRRHDPDTVTERLNKVWGSISELSDSFVTETSRRILEHVEWCDSSLETTILDRMQQRARRVSAQSVVRRWEYRQRAHAKGVWFRLRRLLASARSAWSISEEDARDLLAHGYLSEGVGTELAPSKVIFFVSGDTLRSLPSRVEVPVRLGPELLSARFVALEPFESARLPAG